ncbi:MAG: hypothetical protein WHX93_06725 [bacterium]
MGSEQLKEKGRLRGWFIVVGMALLFVGWGLLLFFLVGDKGPAPWDFGVIKDVPGEAAHSSVGPGEARPPVPQHVDQ